MNSGEIIFAILMMILFVIFVLALIDKDTIFVYDEDEDEFEE